MLDLKFIRENVDVVRQSLVNRNVKLDLDSVLAFDEQRRKIMSELDALRAAKNKANDEITTLLKAKQDAKPKRKDKRVLKNAVGNWVLGNGA